MRIGNTVQTTVLQPFFLVLWSIYKKWTRFCKCLDQSELSKHFIYDVPWSQVKKSNEVWYLKQIWHKNYSMAHWVVTNLLTSACFKSKRCNKWKPKNLQVASPQLSSKLSPKLSPGLLGAGGSILHGTPVSSPSLYPGSGPPSAPQVSSVPTARYEPSSLLRQMTPPHTAKEASSGSITQGWYNDVFMFFSVYLPLT